MILFNVDIVEIIGKELTIRLAEELGGIRIIIPKEASDNSVLGRVIGKEALSKLIDVIGGGDTAQIPLCREMLTAHYHALGMPHAQIARKLRITSGGVIKMIRRIQSKASPL